MFPVLLHIKGIDIHTYPIIIFLGSIFSAFFFSRICLKKKLSLDFLSDYFFVLVITTFIFSRLGGVLENFDLFVENPLSFFYFLDGRFNFNSGFIGFLISFLLITYIKKENFWKWLDASSYPFLLFLFFVAIGEFLSGDNYGTPTNFIFGISYNIPEVRYTIPVHPVQLYEATFIFCIMILIWRLQKKNQRLGMIFLYTLILFFITKTVLSFLRGAPETLIFGMNLSFITSLIITLIFLIIIIIKSYSKINILPQINRDDD